MNCQWIKEHTFSISGTRQFSGYGLLPGRKRTPNICTICIYVKLVAANADLTGAGHDSQTLRRCHTASG